MSCQMFGVFVRLDQLPEVTALLEVIHFGPCSPKPNRALLRTRSFATAYGIIKPSLGGPGPLNFVLRRHGRRRLIPRCKHFY